MTRWTVIPSWIPRCLRVSWSFKILPTNTSTSWLVWQLKCLEISSLNCLMVLFSGTTNSSFSLGVFTVTRMMRGLAAMTGQARVISPLSAMLREAQGGPRRAGVQGELGFLNSGD
uniref:Uncharacterized protein n=1 Tax=Terrapene triunguis TaxID=2587831 RepID=A0A674K2B5_9SAUR